MATYAAAARTCAYCVQSCWHRGREADMTIMHHSRPSRRAILKGGALTVGFAVAGVASDLLAQSPGDASRVLDPKEVDAFLAVNSDGTVTIFCGKVDLGQGLRI